jgi:hypothetical protein
MSSRAFSLTNYVDFLLLHEKDYRASKGVKRDAVLEKIMEDITSDEGCKFKGSTKDLKQVSFQFDQWVPMASSTWI